MQFMPVFGNTGKTGPVRWNYSTMFFQTNSGRSEAALNRLLILKNKSIFLFFLSLVLRRSECSGEHPNTHQYNLKTQGDVFGKCFIIHARMCVWIFIQNLVVKL